MKQSAKKFLRDNLDQRIQAGMKALYPHFEFEHRLMHSHLPTNIVYYSNYASVDSLIFSTFFPLHRIIHPKPTSDSDEDFTREIAQELVNPLANSEGYLVQGFPFNTNQALLLDRYLNGVNLCLHIKYSGARDQSSESTEQNAEYEPLLKYYAKRGSLLELEVSDKLNREAIEDIQKTISQSFKYSS